MAERDEHASREMVTQVREDVEQQREKAIMQRLMAEEMEPINLTAIS